MHADAIDPEAEFQYVSGQFRPSFPTLLAGFAARSATAVAHSVCRLDVRYGPRTRQTFDFFAARTPCRGTLLYFHAGYWQSRDKSGFRFIAPAFAECGLNVALVNYPLCPDVSLAELVQSCGMAPAAVAAHAAVSGGNAGPLVATGHSAGGHIAIELALAASADAAPSRPRITAVIALSGVYDLMPLIATTLNRNLRLDADSAAALSPLHRAAPGAPPAVFVVGAAETPAFIEQSRRMHEAWIAAGNRSHLQIVDGADHFSLLLQFTQPGNALHTEVVALAG